MVRDPSLPFDHHVSEVLDYEYFFRVSHHLFSDMAIYNFRVKFLATWWLKDLPYLKNYDSYFAF